MTRQSWVSLLVGCAVLAPPSEVRGAAPPRPKLAVMELEDRSGDLKTPLRLELTEYLRSRLIASGRFVVIDRGRQAKALDRLVEDARKESRKDCYEKSCQIPLGKALSADHIVRLSVGRVGDTYFVTAERIDLAREATVGGGSAECAAEPSKRRGTRVMQALRSVADQLAGTAAVRPSTETPDPAVPAEERPPPPEVGGGGPKIETGRATKATGDLTVSVKPYGHVRLDLVAPGGEKIASGSPYRNRKAARGRWRVLAQATGHEPWEESFEVPPDEPTLKKHTLDKLGSLAVEGTPAGAVVKVTGPHGFSHQGALPWRAEDLRLGAYDVAVSRGGYEAFAGHVTVLAGAAVRVPVALKRASAASAAAGKAGLTWIALPAGSLQMGSTKGEDDEKPVHPVTLSAFAMSKTEVTVDQYAVCVKAGRCTVPGSGSYANWGVDGRGDHPVNHVDHGQSAAFCAWAGGRLATEAEWEYAGRSGGRDQEYPWGDAAATCQRAVMDEGGNGCGEGRTWPVCSKAAGNTAQGLCDMAGNVWEWVSDWYASDYYQSSPSTNPSGAASGSYRVHRGGGWISSAAYLRASRRLSCSPGYRYYYLGFRCVRSHP